jgi:hypothetical protein
MGSDVRLRERGPGRRFTSAQAAMRPWLMFGLSRRLSQREPSVVPACGRLKSATSRGPPREHFSAGTRGGPRRHNRGGPASARYRGPPMGGLTIASTVAAHRRPDGHVTCSTTAARVGIARRERPAATGWPRSRHIFTPAASSGGGREPRIGVTWTRGPPAS